MKNMFVLALALATAAVGPAVGSPCAGEHELHCGMNMVRATIVVEPR